MTECLRVSAHKSVVEKMSKELGFSILCDKAIDITMKKLFCINVRILDDMGRQHTCIV